MAYLYVLVILLGLLTAANLFLTVGVIRRLREHTAQLAAVGDDVGQVALPAGSHVSNFAALSTDGHELNSAMLSEDTVVAFFSPQCPACKERLPHFTAYASKVEDEVRTVAVAVGTSEATRALVGQLGTVTSVVVEPDRGPMQQAFGVSGYPAFLRVRDGLVLASGYELGSVLAHGDSVAASS